MKEAWQRSSQNKQAQGGSEDENRNTRSQPGKHY